MQNKGENTVCRLCFNSCELGFENIEAVTIEILRFLKLDLHLHLSGKSVICKTCSKNIQKYFDFKTVCVYTEDCISSFRNEANNVKLDLREIYLKVNEVKNIAVSKCPTVCRLCMKMTDSNGWISLNDEINDVISTKAILGKHFSEIDLEITKNPIICASCYGSLQCCFSFIKSLDVESKIKEYYQTEENSNKLQVELNNMLVFQAEKSNCVNGYADSNRKDSDLPDEIKLKFESLMHEGSQKLYIKSEVNENEEIGNIELELGDIFQSCFEEELDDKTEIKCENVETESDKFSIKYEEIDIKTEEGDTDSNQDCSLKRDLMIHKNLHKMGIYLCGICKYETKGEDDHQQHMLIHENASDVRFYLCDVCVYKTKRKSNLKQHMLTHKNALEATTYSCGICTYRTHQERCLKQHMLNHRNSSEVTMYSCETCAYKTKVKSNLEHHTLNHKNASEVTTYSCETCTYKTRHKSHLKRHKLIHRNSSEVTMYSCEICAYKTKRRDCLKRHMLTHKVVSGVVMYFCETCAYKTKRKSNLTQHMLIHKNALEATTYSCVICTYKTTQKNNFNRHLLTHRSSSEVTMYSCDLCVCKTKRKDSLKRHMLIHRNETEKLF